MSDDEDEDEEGGRKRRAPLSRSRRLSSRRRRKAGEEDEAEEGGGDEEAASETPEASAPPPPSEPAGRDDEQEFTRPVSLPSAPGSGTPDFPLVSPPPSERLAGFTGSLRRLGGNFSHFLFGLGRSAQEQGQVFGREVVRPFSSALLEAAISLVLLFVMGACGVYTGRYLKLASVGTSSSLTDLEHKVVEPGEKIDESFFSEGFDTEELHSRANRVLGNYLKALHDQDFRAAYDLLSPEWRSELAFEDFEAGYRTTKVVSYRIGQAETINARQVRIKAEMEVEENGQSRSLDALYLAVLSSQGWRLDGSTYR